MGKQNNLFGVENEGKWMPPPRFVIEFYIKLTPCGAVVSTYKGGLQWPAPHFGTHQEMLGFGAHMSPTSQFCRGVYTLIFPKNAAKPQQVATRPQLQNVLLNQGFHLGIGLP